MERRDRSRTAATIKRTGLITRDFLLSGAGIAVFEKFAMKMSTSVAVGIGVGTGALIAYRVEKKMQKKQ